MRFESADSAAAMSCFRRSIFPSSAAGPTRMDGGGKSAFPSIGLFGQAAEVAEEPIKLFLRDGVEFVVVADAAPQRESKKHGSGRLDAVDRVPDVKLLVDRPPFAGRDVATIKTGRHRWSIVGCGSKSPASCSTVNWSYGSLELNDRINQSR